MPGATNRPLKMQRQQRVGAQAVGAVVLVVALADGVEAGDVGLLVARRAELEPAVGGPLVVGPQAAHRVVDGREDLHRHVARIDALELLVDLQDAAELAVELLARDVRQVEVDALPVRLDAQALVDADVEDLARGDVARHEVAVLRVALFEEVVALGLGNLARRPRVLRLARHPDAAPFAAGRFAHQPQLVGAGDGGGVDLDELAVGVLDAGLDGAAGGAAGADHRHRCCGRRSARSRRWRGSTASAGKARISIVTRSWADAAAAAAVVVEDRAEEVPALVLRDHARRPPSGGPARRGRRAAAGRWSRRRRRSA